MLDHWMQSYHCVEQFFAWPSFSHTQCSCTISAPYLVRAWSWMHEGEPQLGEEFRAPTSESFMLFADMQVSASVLTLPLIVLLQVGKYDESPSSQVCCYSQLWCTILEHIKLCDVEHSWDYWLLASRNNWFKSSALLFDEAAQLPGPWSDCPKLFVPTCMGCIWHVIRLASCLALILLNKISNLALHRNIFINLLPEITG